MTFTFSLNGITTDVFTLETGLLGLSGLPGVDAETAEIARDIYTFITITEANPFHNPRALQQEILRLARTNPRTLSVFMKALSLQSDWKPQSNRQRFADHVDLSFLRPKTDPVLSFAETGAVAGPHVIRATAASSTPSAVEGSLSAEENGDISHETEVLEETHATPLSLLALLTENLERVERQLETLKGKIEEPVLKAYQEEVQEISRRVGYWREQIKEVEAHASGTQRTAFEKDIVIGERLLLSRILLLAASVYSEPISEEGLEGLGLYDALPMPRPHKKRAKPTQPENGVSALVNHDVGFGPHLMLREHQILVLNRLRGILKLRAQMLGEAKILSEELSRGTVVMATGGGKTRQMVVSFAEVIKEGQFKLGDKFIIYNHTDRIHAQNKKVVKLLGDYFKKKMGRDLRVSEYKAENKDLSGDVVVVSLPSINTTERLSVFEKELRLALGEGTIPMAAVDEIHHMELGRGKTKESWQKAVEVLRKISPNVYRIGFTATPTGREGPYLARISHMNLMRAGVTPRLYVVKTPGADLSQLKITTAGDFNTRQLSSTLLGHPERDFGLFEALERYGIRRESKTPSGRDHLEGVLAFAADLEHAATMAKHYAEYFARPGEGLKNRKLEVLGEDRGKIGKKELKEARDRWQAGQNDGIVAVVSGETKDTIQEEVKQGVEEGWIEAVFSVDVWYEGADLHMFSYQLGGRPTFSRFKRGQEGGRLNRRSSKEVGEDGQLLQDPPRILFEPADNYHGEEHLYSYGELMGAMGYSSANVGELFDPLQGGVVAEPDRTGKGMAHANWSDLVKEKEKVKKPDDAKLKDLDWGPYVKALWEVLEKNYKGDLEPMAADLGIASEDLKNLLEGKGWINQRWFLRRMATLLYEDRELLVRLYNEERGLGGEKVTPEDVDILRGAMRLYEEWEGLLADTKIVEGDLGWGELSAEIRRHGYIRLLGGEIADLAWRNLWRGLAIYFGLKAKEEGSHKEEASQKFGELRNYFFKRQWKTEPDKESKRTLLSVAKECVAFRWGGVLPVKTGLEGVPLQSENSPLTRWINGEKIGYSSNYSAEQFYFQIRSLLTGLGMKKEEVDLLIEETVFVERKWPRTAENKQKELLLEARKLVARRFGGVLPKRTIFKGVPEQQKNLPLTRWINGEKIEYSIKFHVGQFYSQVRSLLTGLGMEEEEAGLLIEEAIFEKRGWAGTAENKQEKLLLEARKRVARRFGGAFSSETGLEGVPFQRKEAPLTRWINGKKIEHKKGTPTEQFHFQIRSLLTGLGIEEEEAGLLIEEAVFEKSGWPRTATNKQEALLLEARKLVVRRFGGVLPLETGLEGVFLQRENSPLTRWINGKKIEHKKGTPTEQFHFQIRSLLTGLGMEEEEAVLLIEEAVFEKSGWPRTATNKQEALLLEARKRVTRRFGGVLPQETGLKELGSQKRSPLARWIEGKNIEYSRGFPTEHFYSQVRFLLMGLGMKEEDTDLLIEETIFEERGWPNTVANKQQELLLEARKLMARRFGGVLPARIDFGGVHSQNKDSPLTRWLSGNISEVTAPLASQIRALLIGCGLSAEEAEALLK